MLNFGWLIVIPLIPAVLAHNTESVRLLRVNETVLPSGSDLVFSWAECVICDGYDAHLYLQDTSGVRSIPHQLKSAVTSLKITNLPPRTVYRLVVKRLPSDIYSSEVSGRTSSPEAPLPVENLVARLLTNTSMQIEWTAKNADGFIARVFDNGTAILERVIMNFSNHSIVIITNLKPETDYEVQVTAFYFSLAGNSISAVSSAQVRTLPSILPEITTRSNATKAEPTAPSFTESIYCESEDWFDVRISMTHKLEVINNQESLLLTITKSIERSYYLEYNEIEYQLCEGSCSCADHWTTMPGDDLTLRLDSRRLKAWLPYTLRYRLALLCRCEGCTRRHTKAHSLEIPALRGPVDPVREIAVTDIRQKK